MLACLPVLAGCSASGRNWRLVDHGDQYLSTRFIFECDARSDGKRELREEHGCLILEGRLAVVDDYRTWCVYECEDWRVNDIGLRDSKKRLIADPPDAPYPGTTTKIGLGEVPAAIRQTPQIREDLQAVDLSSVRVRYQLTSNVSARDLLLPSDESLILEGRADLLPTGRVTVYLCDSELKKLLGEASQRWAVLVSAEAKEWKDSFRKCPETRTWFIRQSIDRDMIERTLRDVGRSEL
jgi:hypothetical protein